MMWGLPWLLLAAVGNGVEAGLSYGIDSTLNISQVSWVPEQTGIYIGGPSITRLPGS
eukprot:SAG11_NODE_15057_length_590_cov_1.358452_2_plen_56_part_01